MLKAKLLNFLVFFKQRNILNKSFFNTEVVENCLITKENNHILSFLFCGQYREWQCLTAVHLKDSSLLWQLHVPCGIQEVSELQHHRSCPETSVSGSCRLPLEELVWYGISVKPAGEEERGARTAWPAGTSFPDFIVTHLTDQPFPVISLKLLSQVAVVPRCDGPRLMSDSNPVLTSLVQSGTFRQEGGHNVGTKQLCDLLL